MSLPVDVWSPSVFKTQRYLACNYSCDFGPIVFAKSLQFSHMRREGLIYIYYDPDTPLLTPPLREKAEF